MDELSWCILIGGGVVNIIILCYSIYGLYIGEKSVFHNSGSPISMAQMLLSSVYITGQYLLGIFVIVIICLLMTKGTIQTQAGMPLLSVIIGYLLGKKFKDVEFTVPKKSNNKN